MIRYLFIFVTSIFLISCSATTDHQVEQTGQFKKELDQLQEYFKIPGMAVLVKKGEEVIYEEYEGTYADSSSKMVSKEYGWNHGLSEVVNALIEAGLQIEYLHEYDESPYDVFPDLIKTKSGMYKMKNQLFPMLFEIKATKK